MQPEAGANELQSATAAHWVTTQPLETPPPHSSTFVAYIIPSGRPLEPSTPSAPIQNVAHIGPAVSAHSTTPSIPRHRAITPAGELMRRWSKGTQPLIVHRPLVLTNHILWSLSPFWYSRVPVSTLTDEIPRSRPKFFAFPIHASLDLMYRNILLWSSAPEIRNSIFLLSPSCPIDD